MLSSGIIEEYTISCIQKKKPPAMLAVLFLISYFFVLLLCRKVLFLIGCNHSISPIKQNSYGRVNIP